MSRVRGRSRSSSADSDGTPEKMITGTSAGVGHDDVAARAAAQPQIDDRGDERLFFAARRALRRRFRR